MVIDDTDYAGFLHAIQRLGVLAVIHQNELLSFRVFHDFRRCQAKGFQCELRFIVHRSSGNGHGINAKLPQ